VIRYLRSRLFYWRFQRSARRAIANAQERHRATAPIRARQQATLHAALSAGGKR
jgi:hypothetical protein